jgi:predicted transcriptional regulator
MIVLYMLKRCEVSLSKSQIYDFILEKEYTNFLTLQEVFAELASSELIVEKTMANRTYLELTAEGEETLKFFGNRINPSIKHEIDEYLRSNSMKLRNESSILGDYHKTGDNEYTVSLIAKENGQNLMDLRLLVPTEEIAQSICDNWQTKNQEVYQFIIQQLMM